jgi:hypothetical protein
MPLPLDHPLFREVSKVMNDCIDGPHRKGVGEVYGKGVHPTHFEVTGVAIVQNKMLWMQYEDHKLFLEEKLKGTRVEPIPGLRTEGFGRELVNPAINEAWMFHGTGPINGTLDVIDILTKGTVMEDTIMLPMEEQIHEISGLSHRMGSTEGMFGGGVYVADLSSKANLYVPCPVCYAGCYKGPKAMPCTCTSAPTIPYRMLLCRVLLGKVYSAPPDFDEKSMKVRNPLLRIPGDYDSLVAEKGIGPLGKPGLVFRENVVYNGAQVYPEIIIEYLRKA